MTDFRMQSIDTVDENIERIGSVFPNCLTEIKDEVGKVVKAIDFDMLKQELSKVIVEGNDERYQFTWPDKKKAILLANSPIKKTLRPCKEESVDFENTENLYIEGDNLDVLKLLQETYLEKIKMIYIDPPYNTGSDFIYEDNFTKNTEEYLDNSGQFDEERNRLVQNIESNGRYHTDWLNMIYPRLKIAKNLLMHDGIIYISINDKEVDSLKKICDEIFGERNFIATLVWDKNHSAQAGIYKVYHEYILLYCKDIDLIETPKSLKSDLFEAGAMKKESGRHAMQSFTFPKGTRFNAPDNYELRGEWGGIEKVKLEAGVMKALNGKLVEDVTLSAAYTQIGQMKEFFYGDKENLVDSRGQKIVEFYLTGAGKVKVIKERGVEAPQTTCKFGAQGPISVELAKLFKTEGAPFDSPKPVEMIKDFIARFTENDDIILDFFSGSATTAQAVMELNNLGAGSKRKYILVQVQEDLDESLKQASKDGKKTLQTAIKYLENLNKPHILTEIGKERIKLSSKKMSEEIDCGFRVFKVDSTNMKDVYYNPVDYQVEMLDSLVSNIKEDRTSEDLLFQVMLDLGILLSSKIKEEVIECKKVFSVDDGFLIACFDEDITDEIIEIIAKKKPYYFVMRDSSLTSDSVATNIEQIFATSSPDTIRKVL